MEHLDFVIWMLGYPIVLAVVEAIESKWRGCKEEKYSDSEKIFASLIKFIIWFVVGAFIY